MYNLYYVFARLFAYNFYRHAPVLTIRLKKWVLRSRGPPEANSYSKMRLFSNCQVESCEICEPGCLSTCIRPSAVVCWSSGESAILTGAKQNFSDSERQFCTTR